MKNTRRDIENKLNDLANNRDDITYITILKYDVFKHIQNNDYDIALHILKALNENDSDTGYWWYDSSMGILDTPTPINYSDTELIDDLVNGLY